MTSMYIDFSVISQNKNISLSDFFSEGEIRVIEKGEYFGNRNKKSKYFEWQLYTKKIFCTDTNEILEILYHQCKEHLKEIIDRIHSVEGQVYVYIVIDRGIDDKGEFSISIEPQMLQFLNTLNAFFSIDGIYQ